MLNSYKEFKNFIETLKDRPTLLLHACCGPCSTHTIALLNNYFDITVYYDNSNIDTLEEFNKRLEELKKVIDNFDNVKLIVAPYIPASFYEAVKGDEDLLVVTNKGVIIRVSLEQVKVASRNTQGVRIIKIADNAVVSSIAVVDKTEDALDETNKETVSEVE
jgi:DNA gyrase/topoisomerase IV subunit A